jgi:hypothetical protein
MELDFYDKVNEDHPEDCIFVLKHFLKDELIQLSKEIDVLIEQNTNINLSNLDFIKNISGKTLVLKIGEENMGIIGISGNIYECILERRQYIEMQEMLMQYVIVENGTHYYWLYDTNAEIDFLLSYNGSW